jgi:hypothetical protein
VAFSDPEKGANIIKEKVFNQRKVLDDFVGPPAGVALSTWVIASNLKFTCQTASFWNFNFQ